MESRSRILKIQKEIMRKKILDNRDYVVNDNSTKYFRFLGSNSHTLTDKTYQFNQLTKQFTLFSSFFPLNREDFLDEGADSIFFYSVVTHHRADI